MANLTLVGFLVLLALGVVGIVMAYYVDQDRAPYLYGSPDDEERFVLAIVALLFTVGVLVIMWLV